MAHPKTEVEKRLDRIEIAIIKMLQVGYAAKEAEEIEKILRVKETIPEPHPQQE